MQHGNVGFGADRQGAEFLVTNGTSRCNRRAIDDFLEGHTHGHTLRHRVQHAVYMTVDVAHVQVGADGIRREALLEGGNGIAEPEAGRTVAEVEVDTSLSRFPHMIVDLVVVVRVYDRKLPRKDMCVNVTGTQVL